MSTAARMSWVDLFRRAVGRMSCREESWTSPASLATRLALFAADFVSIDAVTGRPVKIEPPFVPRNAAQKRTWDDSGQRRELRAKLKREQVALEQQLVDDVAHGRLIDSVPARGAPGTKCVSDSAVEATHLVLTSHANTLGVAFGGQIMDWMDSAATISALRYARRACVLVAVDSMDFARAVQVGSAVIIRSKVCRTFGSSMEVGVSVWSEDLLTGRRERCNGANMTFLAEDVNSVPLPLSVPETSVEKRDFHTALTRRRHRIERKVTFENIGETDLVPSDAQLCKAMRKLTKLASLHKQLDDEAMQALGWEPMYNEINMWVKDARVLSLSEERMCCMRGEVVVDGTPGDVLECILNLNQRLAWDSMYAETRSVEHLDVYRRILHMIHAGENMVPNQVDAEYYSIGGEGENGKGNEAGLRVDLCVLQSAFGISVSCSDTSDLASIRLVPVNIEEAKIVENSNKAEKRNAFRWLPVWGAKNQTHPASVAAAHAIATDFLPRDAAEGVEFVVLEQSVRRSTLPTLGSLARGQMFAPSGFVLKAARSLVGDESAPKRTVVSYCVRQLGNEAFGVAPLVQWDLFSQSMTGLKKHCAEIASRASSSKAYSLI